jgi:hypothetical protein
MKARADVTRQHPAVSDQILEHTQLLAQLRPNPSMPQYKCWIDKLAKSNR